MSGKSSHQRNAANNQSLAETLARVAIANQERNRRNVAGVKAENKCMHEKRKAAAEALIGKKVIVKGTVGKAVRIDPKSGSIIIETPFGDKSYDPAMISVV